MRQYQQLPLQGLRLHLGDEVLKKDQDAEEVEDQALGFHWQKISVSLQGKGTLENKRPKGQRLPIPTTTLYQTN